MEGAEPTAAGLAVGRDSNPCTEVILKLISNHYTNLDDDGKSGTIAVTTEPQNTPLKVAVRWLLSL